MTKEHEYLKNPTNMARTLRFVAASLLWWLAEKSNAKRVAANKQDAESTDPEIINQRTQETSILDEESLANLLSINKHLATGSVVLYANHQSMMDVINALALIGKYLPHSRHLLGPVAIKHYDMRRGIASFMTGLSLRLLRPLSIRAIPVIREQDRAGYSIGDRSEMLNRLKAQTAHYLTSPGSVYGIFPEGTRRSRLGKGKGLSKITSQLSPDSPFPLFVPVAFVYDDDGNIQHIRVGKLISVQEIKDDNPDGDVDFMLMEKLSDLLPPELVGEYYLSQNNQ